jgi:hypothetical protein
VLFRFDGIVVKMRALYKQDWVWVTTVTRSATAGREFSRWQCSGCSDQGVLEAVLARLRADICGA